MLFPIPLGYFVSIFLIVSGVLNCIDFITHRPEVATRAELLNGLCMAGWPIVAASVILLLIQVNRQLESLRLESAPAPAPQPKRSKKNAADEAGPAYPPAAEPMPRPQQAAAQVHQPVQPLPRTQVAAQAPRQLYPNSPIPGGGRVPQSRPMGTPAAAPVGMPPVADGVAPAGSSRPAAAGRDDSGKLSYFKVD